MRLRMDSRAKIHAFPQKDLIISDAEQTGIKYIGLKGMDEIYIYTSEAGSPNLIF